MEFLSQHSLLFILVIVLLAIIILALLLVPKFQVNSSGITDPEKRFNAENEARKTIAQIIGGAAILVGLYFTWNTLQVDKEGQITERFTRAIAQLGSLHSDGKPNLEVRLGGIYALEKIALAAPEDYHWTIMEVLTSYIRENAPWPPKETQSSRNEKSEDSKAENKKDEPPKLSADIQAILTVIGRRETKYDKVGQNLNLSSTNLKIANLVGAELETVNLVGANLDDAILVRANLEGANLMGAELEDANLSTANLKRSYLVGANFEYAHLEDAKLQHAFVGQHGLIRGANLKNAYLWEANLEKAHLAGANLEEADLKGAKEIAIEQLCQAKVLYGAELNTKCFVGGELMKCELGDILWDCWEGGTEIECLEGVKEKCPQLLEKTQKGN